MAKVKKKVRDLTLEEVSKICESRKCKGCPLYEFCNDPAQIRFYLDDEVEVEL